MVENIKHIELIEAYVEGKLSLDEKIAFENRLIIDNELSESLDLYKASIKIIRSNSENILKEELIELDTKLDKELYSKQNNNNSKKRLVNYKFIGIAASLLIVLGLSLFLFLHKTENSKLYAQYYIKDKGLPVIMSVNNNSLNNVMNYYKLGNTKQALIEINKLQINDTTLFYKAVFLMDLKETNKAIETFKLVPDSSVFYQKKEYYLALCYLLNDNKKESRDIFIKISNSQNNSFKNKAKDILKSEYFSR